jgi:hypothetical protein
MSISSSIPLSHVATLSLKEKVCRFLNQIDKRIVVLAVVCLSALAAAYFAYRHRCKEERKLGRNPAFLPQKQIDQVEVDYRSKRNAIYEPLKIDLKQLDMGVQLRSTHINIFDPRGSCQSIDIIPYKGTYQGNPVTCFLTVNGFFDQSFITAWERVQVVNRDLPVKLIGACPERQFFMTEDVGDRLWDPFPSHLDVLARLKIAQDLAKILQILHAAGLNYPTLSPDSIFIKTVGNQPQGLMVYFDEGAYVQMQTAVRKHPKFPSSFKSPEAFAVVDGRRVPETIESDMFVFGTILWSLFQGELPPRKRYDEMKESISSGWKELKKLDNCPWQIQNLIEACWSLDPKARPRADDIVAILGDFIERKEESN